MSTKLHKFSFIYSRGLWYNHVQYSDNGLTQNFLRISTQLSYFLSHRSTLTWTRGTGMSRSIIAKVYHSLIGNAGVESNQFRVPGFGGRQTWVWKTRLWFAFPSFMMNRPSLHTTITYFKFQPQVYFCGFWAVAYWLPLFVCKNCGCGISLVSEFWQYYKYSSILTWWCRFAYCFKMSEFHEEDWKLTARTVVKLSRRNADSFMSLWVSFSSVFLHVTILICQC